MKTSLAVVLASLLAIVAADAASALVIDDFESGPFSVTTNAGDPTASVAEQSGLPNSSVRGGVRRTIVGAGSTPGGSATAELVTSGLDDSLVLSAASGGAGSFNLYYDGSAGSASQELGLDLSGMTRITVDTTATGAGGQLRAYLYDSDSFAFSGLLSVGNGTISIDLGIFPGIDLTDIQQIRFFVNGVSQSNEITLGQILAVPEPGTAALLGLGLLGLAVRRR